MQKILLLALFFLFISFTLASPIGVGANPAELSFTDSSVQKFFVINTGETKANYSVYSDNFFLNFSEKSFSLDPKKAREIIVRISNPSTSSFEAIISVKASIDSSNVSSGIRIPVKVNLLPKALEEAKRQPVTESNITGLSILSNIPAMIGLVLFLLIVVALAIMRFGKKGNYEKA